MAAGCAVMTDLATGVLLYMAMAFMSHSGTNRLCASICMKYVSPSYSRAPSHLSLHVRRATSQRGVPRIGWAFRLEVRHADTPNKGLPLLVLRAQPAVLL